jgi:type I restriction enzyme S subunit
MIDARNVYRKVNRTINDFAPEQMANLSAIVWLYRGQKERFLGLVQRYLHSITVEMHASEPLLQEFETELDKVNETFSSFAKLLKKCSLVEDASKEPVQSVIKEYQEAAAAYRKDQSALYLSNFSQTYSEAGLAQSKKWPAGTLCITIAANIAETAILGIDACFPDSVIGFIADENESDVRFVKYKLDFVKQTFQKVSQGAAQDNLSQEKLLSIPLLVPSVAEQRDIADVLSSYDDLIENNRRRMELLEASARHLYEEWFVRLRFPGHEHTKIVNGVPEGWESRSLGDCFVLKRGHDLPEHVRVPGEIPVVSSSGITGYHNLKKADGPGVVTGRYGTLGEVHYIDSDYWPHNTALFVSDFKGNSPRIVHACLRYELLRVRTQSNNAAVPGVNRNVIHTFKLLWPNTELLAHFDDYLIPL